jgi:ectoine hydroxylase-related dioxygenase (phytanoyl-CoA dioxygenase family)
MAKRISEHLENAKRQKGQSWKEHLESKGWAVVPSVLSTEKVELYKSCFWDWMESFGSGIDRSNPESWTSSNWPLSIRGLLQHYRIGHAKFVWDLRTEQAVLDVFAKLWATYDLLVSFDGACCAKPSRDNDNLFNTWAHLDQGPKKAGLYECVQGLVTLTEAGPGLGGLLVYENSHLLHKQFFKCFPQTAENVGSADWCKLEPHERQWYYDRGCKQVQPVAPPGSLILWDSRTVHWAARPNKNAEHCRMAVYLCYVPRSKATKKSLEKRKTAFEKRRMTSHWPAQPKLFPEKPRTYGNDEVLKKFTDRPTLTKEQETPQILKLVGY